MVLKRIVLSGYPVRVHKKKAVVRWMFHNPDDIRWFRPLELWTKQGLRGRIKVPSSGNVSSSAFKCKNLNARQPGWSKLCQRGPGSLSQVLVFGRTLLAECHLQLRCIFVARQADYLGSICMCCFGKKSAGMLCRSLWGRTGP